ncbi:MAG: 2-keto-4-pentenoate hydratase [Dehalococcoidia bacterium]
MTHALDLRAIAHQVKTAQDGVRQIEPFTSQLSGFDVASAYCVARLVHEARIDEGFVTVGRKIGFTNPDMWSLYGVREPIWAYVYDTTVVQLAGTHATWDLRGFAEPKIEPEIVVHFCSAPPVGGDPSVILESIDWIAHGIEIVQSHFPGWKFKAADTVADWGLHGALLVGEPQPVERLGTGLIKALEHFSVSLSCDGKLREVGQGFNVLGSPLAALAHLISILDQQQFPAPLQANELVTTGTLTTALSIHAGETWSTELEGIALPGLSVEFVS